MSAPSKTAREIFLLAVETTNLSEREAILSQTCGDDTGLRRHVEALLKVHDEPDSLLDQGRIQAQLGLPGGADAAVALPSEEGPGAQIGPYKLLMLIGEGGMGAVHIAEQSQPVQRKLALKIIKPGMDSRQVIARFEAERQALAMMDHPHIAKVLDAGTTNSGRPFFVMELVNGKPITQYCDEHCFTARQRLELLIPVCQAIQHAHQKGIIHRDIKPTNILVAEYDKRPVPKVIDFGVAKATGQGLTQKTLFTDLGQIVGTLEYMSPEQAKVNQLDIDTRSDIYSLGVVLYELLTGSTPLDRKRLRSAAFDEMLRIIREEEPPRPSTRLSDSHDALPSISAQRLTEPAKLTKLVRGELDWIVMKALEKDRSRRYESASAFAADIQRYLYDEAVEACPPSAGYRIGKFVRRNRASVLAAAAILIVLVAGIAGTTYGLIQAEHRRIVAERATANEATHRQIADTQRKKAEQAEAETLADFRASADDAIEQLIGSKPNLGARERAYLEKTLKRWQAFAARQGDDERSQAIRAEGHQRVADLWQKLGEREKACREYETACDVGKKLVNAYPAVPRYRQELARSHNNLGLQLTELGQRDAARAEFETARDLRHKLMIEFPTAPQYQRDLANSHTGLGDLLGILGEFDAARGEFEMARDLQQKLAAEFPTEPGYRSDLARTHANFGGLLVGMRQYVAARAECETARDEYQNLVTAFPQSIEYQAGLAAAHTSLGLVLSRLDQRDAARKEYETARDLSKKLADNFPAMPQYQLSLATAHNNLATLLTSMGQHDAAHANHEEALNLHKKLAKTFPSEPEYQIILGGGYCNYGNLLRDESQLGDCLRWYDLAIETLTAVYEQDHRTVKAKEFLRNSHLGRARACVRLKKHAEATTNFAKAIELDPNHAELRCEHGRALIEQKMLDKAVDAFNQALEVDPKHVNAYLGLGRALMGQGKLDEAGAAYRKAIELDPKSSVAHFNLGQVLEARKEFVEAEAVFRELVRIKPTARAHASLGSVLISERNWQEAQSALDDALRLQPNDAFAHSNMAWILGNCPELKFRDFDRALAHAQKAVDLQPTRVRWSHLGAIQYRAGMWRQAAETLQKADQMAAEPDDYHRVYRAMADWRLGDRHEALKHWIQTARWMEDAMPAIKQDEPLFYEELISLRAEAESLFGEFRDTEIACREILRVEPKSVVAHFGLADHLFRSRQWAKSAAAYVAAFDLDEPGDERKWFNGACCLVQAEDTEGYRKLCERMLKRFGQSGNVHQMAHLAHVCVLATDAIGDSDRVLRLAEQRFSLTADINVHKVWSIHVLGLAHYRAGQFEKAVADLKSGLDHPGVTSEIKLCNWLALAMCYRRLGQNGEAVTAFENARAILTSEQRELEQETPLVQILFREAQSLLREP